MNVTSFLLIIKSGGETLDWQKGMNQAIDYMEANLSDVLDLRIVARFAGCSEWEFQRMFSFLTHTTVGGYIRKRRLSLAASEVLTGDEKIITIALKYGYESPTAFSRAFSQQFGLSPSAARAERASLELFPKITFDDFEEGRLSTMDKYSKRGYYVTANPPVYLTNDMDKTCKWFRDILGWYGDTVGRNEAGEGVYGCVFDYPGEIFETLPQRGFYLFKGNPAQDVVGCVEVKGLENLHKLVKANGWSQITDIAVQSWGAKECRVTTIDGSVLRFHDAGRE
jgi:AraC family transcriptional regulator